MSANNHNSHSDIAKRAMGEDEFEQAGNHYTLGAWEKLGESEYTSVPFDRSSVETAEGLFNLLFAGVSYRLSERTDRAANRCRQGILLCEDIRDNIVTSVPQRGIMDEYIGDFRCIGGLDGAATAYTCARESYETLTSQRAEIHWLAEPEFEINSTFVLRFADLVGCDVPQTTKANITTDSLYKRIEYKQSHMPRFVGEIENGVESIEE